MVQCSLAETGLCTHGPVLMLLWKIGHGWPLPVLVLDPRPPMAGMTKTKNPARGPGFCRSVQTPMRATAYPAVCEGSGRRAREVIPAAARALVRMIASMENASVMSRLAKRATNPRIPGGRMQREPRRGDAAHRVCRAGEVVHRVRCKGVNSLVGARALAIPGPLTHSVSGTPGPVALDTWRGQRCGGGRRDRNAMPQPDAARKPIPDRAARCPNHGAILFRIA